jgi:hypothetical protein
VTVIDVKPACAGIKIHEEPGFGSGHPHLPTRISQSIEQGNSPDRIQMRCHFIKQEDRATSGLLGHKVGVGEHDPEQQRLLLTC